MDIEKKLANILRSAGYRVVSPDEAGKPLDERQLGEDILAAFGEMDWLTFGETREEATQRCREAGKYLQNFYQINPKGRLSADSLRPRRRGEDRRGRRCPVQD